MDINTAEQSTDRLLCQDIVQTCLSFFPVGRLDRVGHATFEGTNHSPQKSEFAVFCKIQHVQVGLKPDGREMVVDGSGHFSPAGIDGVHTCLYYYRPIQHIAVPRVIQYNTYTLQ